MRRGMGMGAAANAAGMEGTGSLFRAEAVRAHQDAWLGDIHLATPPRRWLVVGTALILTGAIVAYLFLGQYTRRATVPGTLVPTSGLLNVTALQSGVVRRLAVHLGQHVQAGQPLLDIDGALGSTAMGSEAAVEIAQLQAQQLKLQADLIDQQGLLLDQTDALRSRIAALGAQRSAARSSARSRWSGNRYTASVPCWPRSGRWARRATSRRWRSSSSNWPISMRARN